MSLLPLMGPGQNVELGEVRREIIERSDAKQKTSHMKPLKSKHGGELAFKWFYASIWCYVPASSCKLAVKYCNNHIILDCAHCMVVKTGSSSVRNTNGSSLYPKSLIFLEAGGL